MVGMLRQAQNERKILNPFKCFRLSESSKDDYQEPLVQDIRGAGTADLEAIEKGQSGIEYEFGRSDGLNV